MEGEDVSVVGSVASFPSGHWMLDALSSNIELYSTYINGIGFVHRLMSFEDLWILTW